MDKRKQIVKWIAIPVDLAERISDMLHFAEIAGVEFTESQDETWGKLNDEIQTAYED